MSTKKISELETTSAVSTSDLMETAIPSGSSYASKKMSIAQLATYLENSVVHSALDTQNKTIIDAINELKSICDSLSASHFIVANQLPTSDINMNAIYLIPKQSTGVNDVYEEYICLDDTTTPATWEKIGETQIDLSNYISFDDTDIATTSKNGSMSKGDKSKLNGIDSGAQVNVQSDWNVTDTSSDAFIQHKPSVNKVKQSPIASTNADYPLLLTYSANGTEETNTVWKNTNITYNPSTNTFNVRNGTVKAYTGQYSELVSTFIGFMSGSTLLAYFSPNPNQQTNPVEIVLPKESGTLALQTDGINWSENKASGVKNYFPYPYYIHPLQGETYTQRGIQWTDNGDRGIKANGTNDNTGNSYCQLLPTSLQSGVHFCKLPQGKYHFSGGISADYYINLSTGLETSPTDRTVIDYDYGNGFDFEVTEAQARDNIFCAFSFVLKGKTANNVVFYPMITRYEDSSQGYAEYAMTNAELTQFKADMDNIAPTETSGTAVNSYAVGDYMWWRHGFYRVTQAIAVGDSITTSKVTKTTLGAELKRALT